jgi:hypothetical protein
LNFRSDFLEPFDFSVLDFDFVIQLGFDPRPIAGDNVAMLKIDQ